MIFLFIQEESLASSLLNTICRQNWYQTKVTTWIGHKRQIYLPWLSTPDEKYLSFPLSVLYSLVVILIRHSIKVNISIARVLAQTGTWWDSWGSRQSTTTTTTLEEVRRVWRRKNGAKFSLGSNLLKQLHTQRAPLKILQIFSTVL